MFTHNQSEVAAAFAVARAAVAPVLAAVATMSDTELDSAASDARISYWTARDLPAMIEFGQLVEVIDAERVNRARRGFRKGRQ